MHHHIQDVPLYVGFFCGAAIFILQCAAAAIRAKDNPIKTRRDYLFHNWDVILIRLALETAIFSAWIHYDLTGFIASATGTTLPIKVPVVPMTSFGFGYIADSIVNWITKWQKLPAAIRERIPGMNGPADAKT
jgi:hypothetical protein